MATLAAAACQPVSHSAHSFFVVFFLDYLKKEGIMVQVKYTQVGFVNSFFVVEVLMSSIFVLLLALHQQRVR